MDIDRTFEELSVEMLQGWMDSRQQEHLHLDFKLVTSAALAHRDDRKTFATAVSGFANSSGGLIVWGVDARKNQEGIDCVVGLPGITNIDQMIARLNQLTGEAVEPSAGGIVHRAIHGTGDRGFAVSKVPESDS